MKSLLKLLGMLALTTTPVITVVACDNKNNEMTPRDIISDAAGFIVDSNLQIEADLGLKDNPPDIGAMKDKVFTQLDKPVQDAIKKFFANKLKKSTDEHPTNWYHPDAAVDLIDIDSKDPDINKAKFVLPTNSNLVNGHLLVKANIAYANLTVTKNIMITLTNDIATNKDKVTAIHDFIKSEITAGNLDVNVENLPMMGQLTSLPMARTQLSYIQQNLKVAIEDKVQYPGLNLTFTFSGDFSTAETSTLFTMTAPTVSTSSDQSVIFHGNINNITIGFSLGADRLELDTKAVSKDPTIKINQSFADAVTQITKVFSARTVNPVNISDLPTASQKYSDITNKDAIQKEFIDDGYFAAINKVYNSSVFGANWTPSIITIVNPDSGFNLGPDQRNGYFSLTFKLHYDLGQVGLQGKEFDISVENVHIKFRAFG